MDITSVSSGLSSLLSDTGTTSKRLTLTVDRTDTDDSTSLAGSLTVSNDDAASFAASLMAFWNIACFFYFNRCALVVYGKSEYVTPSLEKICDYPVEWTPDQEELRRMAMMAGWIGLIRLTTPSIQANWTRGLYDRKIAAAHQIDGPRIFLIGGSGTHYGYSGADITRLTGLQTINFGIHAVSGLGPAVRRHPVHRHEKSLLSG